MFLDGYPSKTLFTYVIYIVKESCFPFPIMDRVVTSVIFQKNLDIYNKFKNYLTNR